MRTINPYLNFNGNAEEVLNFYKSVFGVEFTSFQRFKDMPNAENVPVHEREKILHASLPIGENSFLMISDAPESYGFKVNSGNNVNIMINVDAEAEVDHLFNGLSAGGKIEMPIERTFWGSYFGMVTDRFGIHWMVSCELKP